MKDGKYKVYVNFDNNKLYQDGKEPVFVDVKNNDIIASSHKLSNLDKKCILIKIDDEQIKPLIKIN